MRAPQKITLSTTEIELSGQRYTVTLRQNPRARRLSLRFDAVAQSFTLTVPPRFPMPHALEFLSAHRGWMQTCLARPAARQAAERVPFVPGAEIPIRGETCVIRHDPEGLRQPRQADGAVWVGGPAERVPIRVKAWLYGEAARHLSHAAEAYAFQLGKSVTSVTVRDTKSRWGSCTAKGSLNFSWRLIFAPASVLDYVAAHEAAHLVELNHSPRFWALVARLHPDPDAARHWLKTYGTGLHRYG
ncbi:MAG: M48 family metallopeptidase [Elstera sp.]